ncbi:MerR family transcriptional regulator [Streptomyces sp. NPDC051776]|uniref:MerR family transcriptional regulator n=1 Tax=Streptomyces sp. NPDC051776 TaxID=3155414 RepID=UPI003428523A
MRLLTIGVFARAARLSPKALRLYDELGLLTPARVDPSSGYRLYDPAQLERARLVAWLRRLGMPLARIRAVCDAGPGAAAAEVRAYWAQFESDTAARRDLVAFLIDHLSGKDTTTMTSATTTAGTRPGFAIRYAAASDTGTVRERNEDTAYAGPRLLAVADGFGGAAASATTASATAASASDTAAPSAGVSATPAADTAGTSGVTASAVAIEALRALETDDAPLGNLLNSLEEAAHRANNSVGELAASDPALHGMGTTLTALLWSGSRLALVHIGDSRAYLLRDGRFFQITHDHTLVRAMIDEGRITAEEAASHPQRALLLRALGGGGEFAPDLGVREVRAGDRYLLCSDGLSAVVGAEDIRDVVASAPAPGDAVRELIDLAVRAGGPDNVSCVVADVVEDVVEPREP